MGKILVDKPDGEKAELPVTWLTYEQAQLMFEYRDMMSLFGLQAEMVCGKCNKDAECYVQHDIGIFCDCSVRVWKRS